MKKFDLEKFRVSYLPSEFEIFAGWRGDLSRPLVSIVCTSFNQERYIEDTLRGFLTQKTNFPFEIIVHDDASTDGTPKIIMEYAERYPRLIKSVIQKENQYSQGKRIFPIAVSYSVANYIAACEGDDFWICENKLQNQFDALSNSESDLCFTYALKLYGNNTIEPYECNKSKQRLYPLGDIIRLGGAYVPTVSMMMSRSVFDSLPDWFQSAPVGDEFICILSSLRGPAICLPLVTAAYRVDAVGSWSANMKRRPSEKIQENLLKMIRYLDYTKTLKGVDSLDVDYRKASFYLLACEETLDEMDVCAFRDYLQNSMILYPGHSTKQSLYFKLRYFPVIVRWIRYLKDNVIKRYFI